MKSWVKGVVVVCRGSTESPELPVNPTRVYLKYFDTLINSLPNLFYNWTSPFYNLLVRLQTSRWETNHVDPDQTPRFAASDLGLHCLHRPICPTT